MKDIDGVYERWSQFGLVSISDDQRRPLPFANWKATVHHGMPSDLHAFSPKSSGYLAFLGRISPEKRPDRAIRIGRALAAWPTNEPGWPDDLCRQYRRWNRFGPERR